MITSLFRSILLVLVEQFYRSLHAPYKKLIWFEYSAHNPDIEEPDKFQRELIAIGDEFCSEKHAQDALVANKIRVLTTRLFP